MSRATILLAFAAAWILHDVYPAKLQIPLTFLAMLALCEFESWMSNTPPQPNKE